jgi:hypothetical protein
MTNPTNEREAERAAIVAWLRGTIAKRAWQAWSDELTAEMARDLADAIERGQHLNKDT